jgi:hypothetical protein
MGGTTVNRGFVREKEKVMSDKTTKRYFILLSMGILLLSIGFWMGAQPSPPMYEAPIPFFLSAILAGAGTVLTIISVVYFLSAFLD